MRQQIEGRSLVPLLENPNAPWEDRYLVAHQGRWPRFSDPNESKYKMCSIRNSRWQLISENGATEPNWQLFDLKNDYSEEHNVAAANPAVVKELSDKFDEFWKAALPLMVNEKAVGPKINPFQELYYKQFGGSPSPEDLKKMESSQSFSQGAKGKRKAKTN